jgi:uncharacterized membrane protein YphA (DoxX/SURF4 family)
VFEAFCREKLGPLALRLALGVFCFYSGYLKIMAAGGTAWLPGMPVTWQVVLSWGEFCAGVAILLGFRCRIAAAVVLAITVGMLLWIHGWRVFRLQIRDLEMVFLFLLSGLALLFVGAGGFSLDARMMGKMPGGNSRR